MRILFFLLALTVGGYAMGQDSYASRQEMRKEMEKKWKRALDLSPEQYASLKLLNRESAKKTREIRMDLSLDYKARWRELQRLTQQRNNMLKILLTDKQEVKLSKLRKRQPSRKS